MSVKNKNGIIIFGDKGSGKTKMAIQKAKKNGEYSIINIKNLFTPFGLSHLPFNNIQSVIVEECSVATIGDPRIKRLISSTKLLIEKKHKDPILTPNVQWIFVIRPSRRFSIINLQ